MVVQGEVCVVFYADVRYVWAADPSHGYNHTDGGYGQLKMVQLQCTACHSMTMHGVTITEAPFYFWVVYGGVSPETGLTIDVAQYKQVGAWYV